MSIYQNGELSFIYNIIRANFDINAVQQAFYIAAGECSEITITEKEKNDIRCQNG
jgi:hypothetical protein